MKASEIVKQIEMILKEKNIKKTEFYKACGISPAMVSNWRRDKNFPLFDTLRRINEYLGTSLELTDTKKPAPIDGDGLKELIQIMGELDASRRSKLLELARLYLDDQRRSEEKE